MGLKAVHFGGGNIGRGFVGEKLCQSGYEVAPRPPLLFPKVVLLCVC